MRGKNNYRREILMKVLIWILCIFANALITTLLKEAGILLGGIPSALLFGGSFWLAHKLCKKWDEHQSNNKVMTNEVKNRISEQNTINNSTEIQNNVNLNKNEIICKHCKLATPSDSDYCQNCGNKIVKKHASTPKPKQTKRKSVLFTNVITIILTIIAIILLVLAMNFQDARKNIYENWSPTIVYAILISLYGLTSLIAIISLTCNKYKILPYISSTVVVAMIVTSIEGSIYSSWHMAIKYINSDIIKNLNMLCTVLALIITLVSFVPLFEIYINTFRKNWHKSMKYREKCYKKAAQIHNYLEKGIITNDEYEKAKSEIFKYLE